MPPFLDPAQIHQAITTQAIPALEAILANDNLRSLRRFERDDPPPYESSTESEELDDDDFPPPLRGGPMPEELKAIMDRPIDEDEFHRICHMMQSIVRPHNLYYTEAKREQYRFSRQSRRRGPLPVIFRGLNGTRREGVIVRHNVKRRWEKLGIWNPEWGFAGRKVQRNDQFLAWTWRWQPDGVMHDYRHTYNHATDLIARAMHLRKNLRRGEHAPVIPRSHPGPDTTAAQAESFLISRPWFMFQIEIAEETLRYERLSNDDQMRHPYSARNQVIEWWKERGDWRDEFDTNGVFAWKWRHESPSPEPEDLTPIDNIQDSVLEDAAEMEFTPSEIDELETIDLPRSEQPKGFWVVEEGDMPPFFPGQMEDELARVEKREKERAERLERARAEGYEEPVDPVIEAFKKRFFPGGGPISLFSSSKPVEEEQEASPELQEVASETQRDPESPPPQKRRRLRQRQQPRSEIDKTQDQDEPLPTPRRSARIAAIKRPAEPLPSQTAPNKRPRRAAAPKAPEPAAAPVAQPATRKPRRKTTAPVPARATPKGKTDETRPSQRRGRPRKESAPSARSTASKEKPARTSAPPKRRGKGSKASIKDDAPSVPKRRGRPRKNE